MIVGKVKTELESSPVHPPFCISSNLEVHVLIVIDFWEMQKYEYCIIVFIAVSFRKLVRIT